MVSNKRVKKIIKTITFQIYQTKKYEKKHKTNVLFIIHISYVGFYFHTHSHTKTTEENYEKL